MKKYMVILVVIIFAFVYYAAQNDIPIQEDMVYVQSKIDNRRYYVKNGQSCQPPRAKKCQILRLIASLALHNGAQTHYTGHIADILY